MIIWFSLCHPKSKDRSPYHELVAIKLEVNMANCVFSHFKENFVSRINRLLLCDKMPRN